MRSSLKEAIFALERMTWKIPTSSCAPPITIGARAWIAAEAFVGPGVTVGEGSVLGARSCAMRNIPDWMIYSGNPAMPLRERKIRFD
jgi:putative colanic acid biosynthesis acetyltransferase WcaF